MNQYVSLLDIPKKKRRENTNTQMNIWIDRDPCGFTDIACYHLNPPETRIINHRADILLLLFWFCFVKQARAWAPVLIYPMSIQNAR